MFRFTIRDVLWLMVVVGMGCGWWATESARRTTREHAERLRQSLSVAKGRYDGPVDAWENDSAGAGRKVEWELADQLVP
jgi:hypothetical protein